jgi:hypothetical protein
MCHWTRHCRRHPRQSDFVSRTHKMSYCSCLVVSGRGSQHAAQGKKSRLDLIRGVKIVSVEAKESVSV